MPTKSVQRAVYWHQEGNGNDAPGERFHVGEMPLTLLIDRSGRIALSHAGIVDKTQFENDIHELLQ